MIEITLALVVATPLCLAFATTRWIGISGIALMFILHPLLCTALLILGGVVFYFTHFHKRSTHHDQPKLPSECD